MCKPESGLLLVLNVLLGDSVLMNMVKIVMRGANARREGSHFEDFLCSRGHFLHLSLHMLRKRMSLTVDATSCGARRTFKVPPVWRALLAAKASAAAEDHGTKLFQQRNCGPINKKGESCI